MVQFGRFLSLILCTKPLCDLKGPFNRYYKIFNKHWLNKNCCNTKGLSINVVITIYEDKYYNAENKVNDIKNFYMVYYITIPRGYTRRIKYISIDQISQTPIDLCKERLSLLQLPQFVCIDVVKHFVSFSRLI